MARLLITGGAGFIGANFTRFWRAEHPDDVLVVLDALTYAGDRRNLEGVPDLHFVQGDICDTDRVARLLRDHRLDTIVNFAAESHVDRSIAGPDAFVETNVVGTHSLLKAARAVWLDEGSGRPHRFHQVSTDEVYGSLAPDAPPSTEADPYRPNSPYAASKAAADHLVRAYTRTFGLQASITACSNNYGPFQHPEKLIPLFIANALSGRAMPLYGDGMNMRDWLHVEDHVRALALALNQGEAGELYNIGGGAQLPNLGLVDLLCGAIDRAFAADEGLAARFPDAPPARGGSSAELKRFVADRPGHDRRYAIDPAKAERALGYRPRRRIEEGLAATVRWFLQHEDWWRPKLAS